MHKQVSRPVQARPLGADRTLEGDAREVMQQQTEEAMTVQIESFIELNFNAVPRGRGYSIHGRLAKRALLRLDPDEPERLATAAPVHGPCSTTPEFREIPAQPSSTSGPSFETVLKK